MDLGGASTDPPEEAASGWGDVENTPGFRAEESPEISASDLKAEIQDIFAGFGAGSISRDDLGRLLLSKLKEFLLALRWNESSGTEVDGGIYVEVILKMAYLDSEPKRLRKITVDELQELLGCVCRNLRDMDEETRSQLVSGMVMDGVGPLLAALMEAEVQEAPSLRREAAWFLVEIAKYGSPRENFAAISEFLESIGDFELSEGYFAVLVSMWTRATIRMEGKRVSFVDVVVKKLGKFIYDRNLEGEEVKELLDRAVDFVCQTCKSLMEANSDDELQQKSALTALAMTMVGYFAPIWRTCLFESRRGEATPTSEFFKNHVCSLLDSLAQLGWTSWITVAQACYSALKLEPLDPNDQALAAQAKPLIMKKKQHTMWSYEATACTIFAFLHMVPGNASLSDSFVLPEYAAHLLAPHVLHLLSITDRGLCLCGLDLFKILASKTTEADALSFYNLGYAVDLFGKSIGLVSVGASLGNVAATFPDQKTRTSTFQVLKALVFKFRAPLLQFQFTLALIQDSQHLPLTSLLISLTKDITLSSLASDAPLPWLDTVTCAVIPWITPREAFISSLDCIHAALNVFYFAVQRASTASDVAGLREVGRRYLPATADAVRRVLALAEHDVAMMQRAEDESVEARRRGEEVGEAAGKTMTNALMCLNVLEATQSKIAQGWESAHQIG